MYSEIKKIKSIFDSGGNVMEYLRESNGEHKNSVEAIKISYDLQAGTYIQTYKNNLEFNRQYTAAVASILEKLGTHESILEAGVGEATTLANVVEKLSVKPMRSCGFDISWSRINYARKFAKSKGMNSDWLFTGDLFNIPLADNSIDIVYTSHSVEPNGGREEQALIELYRVASRYLVLLEPTYELASDEAKARMDHHGYVKNLKQTAEKLGFKIVENRLFEHSINPLNPTGLTIIEKNASAPAAETIFICPVTGGSLAKEDDCYYAPESLLAYPIVGGIPCLLAENAILASGFKSHIEL
ncbi:MAG: methyltransferase domain-containing protein [Bacteroidia bacterium]